MKSTFVATVTFLRCTENTFFDAFCI